ncbi:MAG: DnaJ C-terminal domain-containing protein [Myxococcota bacterium]|nr:DnaJ C-terminal domain-containing protein [Myxococcota bacterium]
MTPDRRDPYEVLGVARDADADAIRTAYRALARKLHPDVNPGDSAAEERFKEVSEAYAVLSDEEKRKLYDEFGPISLEGGFDPEAARAARSPFGGGFPGASSDGAFGSLEDLFGGLFGGGARGGFRGGGGFGRGFAIPGQDLEATLELEFLEAARGCERTLSVGRPTADGGVRHESVSVRIPPGVDEGGRIRLPQKGGEGHGGAPPGDLYARIRIRPHAYLRRDGRNLLLDVPVTVGEATLGAKVEIPTLEGRATVTIPPGTDSGQRLRLRGKGIPHPKGGPAGDLYATVQIRVPRDLDDAARERLAGLAPFDPPGLRKEWE